MLSFHVGVKNPDRKRKLSEVAEQIQKFLIDTKHPRINEQLGMTD